MSRQGGCGVGVGGREKTGVECRQLSAVSSGIRCVLRQCELAGVLLST